MVISPSHTPPIDDIIIIVMIERISTGIQWLDNHIEHGLPKNRVTIITGDNGVGKSVFGLQYLRAGLYTDEKVAYITTKDSPHQIMKNFSELGWDLSWAIEQQRLWIIDCRHYFPLQIDQDEQIMLTQNLIKEIGQIIDKHQLKRLVVDPLLPVSLLRHSSYVQQYISQFMQYLNQQSIGVSTLILHKPNVITNQIEIELSAAVIELKMQKESGSMQRFMILRKIENTPCPKNDMPFDIKKEGGIVQA